MTLAEVLTNEELRQHEFPVAREKVFLAHAGVCPLPRRVADAISSYVEQCTRGDQETLLPVYELSHLRELVARIIAATPEEVALVGPTSLGLSFIAEGVQWRPGDHVVAYFDDYPSNVYPWMALERRGVQVRWIKTSDLGRIETGSVLDQVDERTRLVALASCHFISGRRIDLEGIGRALRERGILFCVDGIQTAGAFPTPAAHFDFLAADAHKWLLGPCAAGILYVRKSLQAELMVPVYGWHNIRSPQFVAQEELVFRNDARRYEAGTHNLVGLVGLKAALELILEIGIEEIGAEVLRKRAWLSSALEAKGYLVLGGQLPPEQGSGILSFYRPGADLAPLHTRLEQANVITSLRVDRSGQRYIRIAPHFYNTDEELHRLLELV